MLKALRTMLLCAIAALPAVAGDQKPKPSHWHAWLDSPGGELVFGLELAYIDGGITVWLVNGEERIEVPHASLDAGELSIDIDHYDARIRARVDAQGVYRGEWKKRIGEDRWAQLPFGARWVEQSRSPKAATPPAPLAAGAHSCPLDGRWSVDFEKSEEPAVGIFESAPDGGLRGTFLTTTGDYRFLAGSLEQGEMTLSCFDGAHAFLFRARLLEDGSLSGDFWSRDSWHERWTARRDPEASLPDAFQQTRWIDEVELGSLAFPDRSGKTRKLDDPAFAGKVRILQIFGSWCPNCHDETAYLVELDRRYRARGLSILGLAFEVTGDFERDARQVEKFARRHKADYPILIAGLSDKKKASAAFPALDRIRSFPTTIFLDAESRVRGVHSGFSGPATGKEHAKLRAEFEGLIERLLGEASEDD